MEHSQESAFCVPTYSNSESACDGQTIDHTGRKQQRDSDEQVPVFQPRWRDQAQVKLEQLQPGGAAYAAASGHSTESSVHGSDEQAASNQRYMQVSVSEAWRVAATLVVCNDYPPPPPLPSCFDSRLECESQGRAGNGAACCPYEQNTDVRT